MMRRAIAAVRASGLVGARGRRILHTGVWSMIAKAAAAANLFLTVPFVLNALGPSQFGVWATLASLITFAGFLDFGLGNGTMNLVASAHGRGEEGQIGTIVREGRRALILIALLLGAIALVAVPWTPWHRLLGVPEAMSSTARASVGIVIATIVLAVPLNLATRVQLGMGQGDRAFKWQAIGQALTACLVIVLTRADAGLELLVAATVATPLLASIANNVQLSRSVLVAQPPAQIRNPSIAAAIRNEGVLFFILQLAAALAFSADLPLISALRGPEEAGQYAIVQRLFSIIPMALGLVWMPLWPIYRQALAAGDHGWALQTFKLSTIAAICIAAVLGAVIAFGFEPLITLWLRQGLMASSLLLAGFATWTVFEAGASAVATFLNAASVLRFQVIIACAFALCCLTGKVLALAHGHVSWLPWVTLASWSACALLPLAIYRHKIYASVLAEGH